jgi:cell division GTPase FtsZ
MSLVEIRVEKASDLAGVALVIVVDQVGVGHKALAAHMVAGARRALEIAVVAKVIVGVEDVPSVRCTSQW